MAKDGTCRGGARVGAGAKKKPLADKIASGNPSGRPLTVMEFTDAPKLEGVEMPEPNKMLSAEQKDGTTLAADEIYRNTWAWLNARGCAALVSPQLLERYAMSVARWIQCEEAVSSFGFLARHPTITVSTLNARVWIDDAVFTSLFDEPSTVAIAISAASMELKPVSTLPI